MAAATATLYAARNLAFAPTLALDYQGDALPLAGASVSMQVRMYGGEPGTAEAEDPAVGFIDAEHPTKEGWRQLTLTPVIAKADLAAMPSAFIDGSSDAFVFEIKLTYADAAQDSLMSGDFILAPGVDDT